MNFARRPLLQSVARLRTLGCYARPRPILCMLNSNNAANDVKFARITSHFVTTKEENPQKKVRFQEVDDHGFQIPIEDSTRYTDEEKSQRKRMGQYYSMLIASLVGLISSSYLLYIRMVNVEAKALEDGSQETLRDQEKEEQQATQMNIKATEKVALHKSKAGFRERKVRMAPFGTFSLQNFVDKNFFIIQNDIRLAYCKIACSIAPVNILPKKVQHNFVVHLTSLNDVSVFTKIF